MSAVRTGRFRASSWSASSRARAAASSGSTVTSWRTRAGSRATPCPACRPATASPASSSITTAPPAAPMGASEVRGASILLRAQGRSASRRASSALPERGADAAARPSVADGRAGPPVRIGLALVPQSVRCADRFPRGLRPPWWLTLHPDVPHEGGGKLEHAAHALSVERGLHVLTPGNVRHLVEGEHLDLLGELLAPGRVAGAHPVHAELLEVGIR